MPSLFVGVLGGSCERPFVASGGRACYNFRMHRGHCRALDRVCGRALGLLDSHFRK